MKAIIRNKYTELFLLVSGGLLLVLHAARTLFHVAGGAFAVPPHSAYGAGQLTGALIAALCPLVIGIGLFVIAASRHGDVQDRAAVV